MAGSLSRHQSLCCRNAKRIDSGVAELRADKLIPGTIRRAARNIRKHIASARASALPIASPGSAPHPPTQGLAPFAARLPLQMDGTVGIGPVRLLSLTPPIFLSGMAYIEFLGLARAFSQRYGNINAGFIIYPTWSIEYPGCPEAIKQQLVQHCREFSNHKFRFICNSPVEAQLLQDVGISAVFLNKNFTVSDQVFCPIGTTPPEYDAIYVTRFIPEKRLELAASIPTVAYVAYVQGEADRQQEFRDISSSIIAANPRHTLLNDIVDGLPVAFSHGQVNAALARASVGLILSEVEGSSYASMEYLLAGLPVVSTHSKGGREAFFDPDFCIICEPDANAVRNAVAELRARNIPREIIRARTLHKIQPERDRFLALVDDLIEEFGQPRRFAPGSWPFSDFSGIPWHYFSHHLNQFADLKRQELCRDIGLDVSLLDGVQLEANELRPVVDEVKKRSNCAFLVFGCGKDSVFWERLNYAGITAFIEDNPTWAANTRESLSSSAIYEISYGTDLCNWQELLDNPAKLYLDLPIEIRARKWDVILVDGPAGYEHGTPGRMKSIFAAAELVSSGGCVLVHDVERPAENAYASRYLGDERAFVEVQGRALLKGYAF